ncbi:MAG: formate/nitrite transporter family protein [Oligoflexales bacterium]
MKLNKNGAEMTQDKKIILPPDFDSGIVQEEAQTHRTKEREKEDEKYIPVIIKRIDEIVKHPDDTLSYAIKEGFEQFKRPAISLFLSSIVGGLIIGFVAMLAAFATSLVENPTTSFGRLIIALFYPLGFIVCVMSGAKLYTEQTATAIYPVMDKQASVVKLLKLWGYVLCGNLIGTFISAVLLTSADEAIQLKESYDVLAHHLVALSPQTVFISAILAGWLMAQGSWLILSTSTASGQILCVYIVTFIIGVGGLTHSIAGSAELFLALLGTPSITIAQAAQTLLVAIIGNSIGGSFFVGVLNYAHIRITQSYS